MVFRKKRKDPFKEIQACLQKRDYKGALELVQHTAAERSEEYSDSAPLRGYAGARGKQERSGKTVADHCRRARRQGLHVRAIAINKKILQIDPRQTDVHEKLAEMKEERSTATSHPTLGGSVDAAGCADPACQ